MSFDKDIFWSLKVWNDNLIYSKIISLLPKTEYNNHGALFPFT